MDRDTTSWPGLTGLTGVLVAAAIGVYLLVIVGAGTALLDGAAACPTWPLCAGDVLVGAGLAVAAAHRLVAVLVFGLLLAAVLLARRRSVDARVGRAVGIAVALYPGQVVLGALVATTGAPTLLSGLHLVVAMSIFSAVLVALLWNLEAMVPGENETVLGGLAPPEAGPDPEPVPPAGAVGRVKAYVTLTKPKLWWLLCLVALAAMGLAGGRTLDPVLVAGTLVGGVLAIAASGTFNNVLERDRDERMARTADRPLVRERIPTRRAVAFGVFLTIVSVATFLSVVNVLAAILGLLAILFYSVLYTLVLKPHTTQNVVLGGAVGAFPALIGWAAVERTVGLPALVLGAVIFLWTPAHFYNLALAYKEDYARAGFPMLPVVRGNAVTRRHITLYLGGTLLGTVALGTATRLGWVYAGTTVTFGAVFLWAVVRLHRERTESAAFRTFHASNLYLGTLLVAVLVDTLVI